MLEVVGWPKGSYTKDIEAYLKGDLLNRLPGFTEAYSKGARNHKGWISFPSEAERRTWAAKERSIRAATGNLTVQGFDGTEHQLKFFYPTPVDDRPRQFQLRTIKRAIKALLPDLADHECSADKARGEVWLRHSLVATVGRDSNIDFNTDKLEQEGLSREALESKIAAAKAAE